MLCFPAFNLVFNFFIARLSGVNVLFLYKMAGREEGALTGIPQNTPKWALDHLSPLSSIASCASWATNATLKEPSHLYGLYIPPHGKRKPGRQPTNFLKYIQELLGDSNDMLLTVQIAQMACDRTANRQREEL